MKNSNHMFHLLSAVLIAVLQDVRAKKTDVILGNSTCSFQVYHIVPDEDAVRITWNGNALPKNCRLGFTSHDDSYDMHVKVKDENKRCDFTLKFYRESSVTPIDSSYNCWLTSAELEFSFESSSYIYIEFLANVTSGSKSSHALVVVKTSYEYTVFESIVATAATFLFVAFFCIMCGKRSGSRMEFLEAIGSCCCGIVNEILQCFRKCYHRCKANTCPSGISLPLMCQGAGSCRQADEERPQQSTTTTQAPPDFDDIMQEDSNQNHLSETNEMEPPPYVPPSTDDPPPPPQDVPPPSYYDVVTSQY